MIKYIAPLLTLCFVSPAFAETNNYQTAEKPPPEARPSSQLPPLSISPETGKTRVFIAPEGSFNHSLVSSSKPVYHAQAFYEPTPSGLSKSQLALHRQMASACPKGWLKLQEWANLHADNPELHYRFQCLE